MQLRRRHIQALAALTVAGAILRFATLGLQSFDHDEAVTAIRVIQPSLFDTLATVTYSERTPHLYYVLAWGWLQLFGNGEVALRSLSALFGVATIPVAYTVAATLATRRAGLIVAALVAFNPFLIWYSQEARAYALFVFFSALALLFFVRSLRQPAVRNLSLWALFSALALATHYFALFLFVGEALWLIASTGRRRQATAAVVAVVAVGLALLPLVARQNSEHNAGSIPTEPLAIRIGSTAVGFAASPLPHLTGGGVAVRSLRIGACAVVGVVFLFALISLGLGRPPPATIAVAFAAGAALVLPLAVALVAEDVITARNMIGVLVPALIVVGVGLSTRRAAPIGLPAAVVTCLVFVAIVVAVDRSPAMQRDNWRKVSEVLGAPEHPRILLTPKLGGDPLLFYLRGNAHKLAASSRSSAQRRRAERLLIAPHGVRVREIDLITARGGAFKSPAPGFRASGTEVAGKFEVTRFTSPTPRTVTATNLRVFERGRGRGHVQVIIDGP